MKSKSNIITFIFIITALFLALISHLAFRNNLKNNVENFNSYHFLVDAFLIIGTGILIRFVIARNDKRNIGILKQLQTINTEIKDSNERYDIVAKATSDTIWDWKIQTDEFVWNKGIQGVFGYKNEDVGNSSNWWFDRIHPEDSLKMSVKLYSFLEQKTERWQDEYRFKCADGSYKYVFDRGFLLKDIDGKAIRMIGAIQDVTKQKEEEQRLKLLETVITQTKDAVVITNTDISENPIPNIIFVNQAFAKMTGYKPKEVIGKSPIMFAGVKSDSNELKKLTESIKNYQECFIETVSYKKNGDEYWVNFSMIPVTNKEVEHSHWISIQRTGARTTHTGINPK
jgi:PAS domain S-box-containing protein